MIDLYRVNARQAKTMMLDIMEAGLTPYITSSPGIGKSAITHSVNDILNTHMIDHRMSGADRTDMNGLPRFKADGTATFAPFADLFPLTTSVIPEGKNGWFIFLDEFNSAPRDVLASAYKLVLDRMVGQEKLHENAVIAAAGNLDTDRSITTKMPTALQSRFIHIELEFDFDVWMEDVALVQHYDPRIIAYLNFNKSAAMDFNPDHKEKTYCCPRTWEFMNRLIQNKPVISSDHAALFAGTITSGIGAEFVTFNEIYKDLVDLKTILAAPLHAPLPDKSNAQWAVIINLMSNINDANFEHLAAYVNRFTITFRVLFFKSILVRHPNLRRHPAFAGAMSEVARYLNPGMKSRI